MKRDEKKVGGVFRYIFSPYFANFFPNFIKTCKIEEKKAEHFTPAAAGGNMNFIRVYHFADLVVGKLISCDISTSVVHLYGLNTNWGAFDLPVTSEDLMTTKINVS